MWPFRKKAEQRQSGGDFSDSVIRLIESQAAGSVVDTSSTAAVEAASGALSRAFASAEVKGAPWVKNAVTPSFLSQVGRDLIRSGDSLHIVRVSEMGQVILIPCSSWHFEGGDDPATWRVRTTSYGPSSSTTENLPFASVIFAKWGATPGQSYIGIGPTRWAHTTARLQSEVERSLADESGGPISQLLAIPIDGGDGTDKDPLKALKADIRSARGKALFVETTADSWGEGEKVAPKADWKAARLGPNYPVSMAKVQENSFSSILGACGCPPGLFAAGADGTSQRESLRRWHLNTVIPLAKLLEHELSMKLETEVRLEFDSYAMDMVSRSTVVNKLVSAGVSVDVAMKSVGLTD